jgi:hypothetical protein
MAGAVHEAKNMGEKIFDSDKLYDIAFGYDLPPARRFDNLAQPLPSTGSDDALENYVDDLLFGYAIYQHAVAAFKWLYADRDRQLKREAERTDSIQSRQDLQSALEHIAAREFVKYWAFDVVRLVHIVVEEWVNNSTKREDIRKALVGDLTLARYLDPLFLGKAKRPQWFTMESDPSRPSTLDRMMPCPDLPNLGTWFKSLEKLAAEVLEQKTRLEPNVAVSTLVLKRPATHEDIVAKLKAEIAGASFPELFPVTPLR